MLFEHVHQFEGALSVLVCCLCFTIKHASLVQTDVHVVLQSIPSLLLSSLALRLGLIYHQRLKVSALIETIASVIMDDLQNMAFEVA